MILAKEQTTGLGLRVEIDRVNYESDSEISVLTNAVYWFLEDVFIIKADEGFILAVIHQKKMLLFKPYKTVKGARIAFLKIYGYKACREKVKAEWTPFYLPDAPAWFKEKLNVETMAN